MGQTNNISMEDNFLRQLHSIVLQNIDNEQFSVEQLSKEIGISRSQLHRKLKVLRDKSVSQYIREVRLQEAMKLLQDEAGTVSEIAWKVGFGSPSYFNKCFQKYYGYPPGEVKSQPVKVNSTSSPVNTMQPVVAVTSKSRKIVQPVLIIVLLIVAGIAGWLIFNSTGTTSKAEKSIAVLPFTNLSTEQENQYFADGLVEDLLSRLSHIKEMKVISRTSSDVYRERGKQSLPQIASNLGVTYIVEGSVQKYGNKARISVQLIDATTDKHVWAKYFDRDLQDIFEVQSEIATHIASEVNSMLSAEQTRQVQKNQTVSFKAYELYHLGRYYWNKRTDEGYHKSIEYYKQAITEDSSYALAYAGLADTYNLMAIQQGMDKQEGRDKAVELATKALSIDDHLAEAYTVLGSIYDYVDWNWEAAEQAFQRALEINPNYATAHHYYSEHLSILGRHEEARQQINIATELDPLSFVIRFVSTKLYFHNGQFKEADISNQKMKEFQPDHYWTYLYGYRIQERLGQNDKAFEIIRDYFAKNYDKSIDTMTNIYKRGGLHGFYRWMVEDYLVNVSPKDFSPYHTARLYAIAGDNDKAMEWLQKSFDEHEISPEVSFNYYFLRQLGSRPAFKNILQQMGLPVSSR